MVTDWIPCGEKCDDGRTCKMPEGHVGAHVGYWDEATRIALSTPTPVRAQPIERAGSGPDSGCGAFAVAEAQADSDNPRMPWPTPAESPDRVSAERLAFFAACPQQAGASVVAALCDDLRDCRARLAERTRERDEARRVPTPEPGYTLQDWVNHWYRMTHSVIQDRDTLQSRCDALAAALRTAHSGVRGRDIGRNKAHGLSCDCTCHQRWWHIGEPEKHAEDCIASPAWIARALLSGGASEGVK